MKVQLSSWLLAGSLIASSCLYGTASAQVIEEREQGDSNPGKSIFRTTLYGAGTGLVLGGAYALIEDDEDTSTVDCLKWGTAIGAATGLVIGIVYVVARPEPKGDIESVDEDDDAEEESSLIHNLEPPTVMMASRSDLLGNKDREVALNLVNLRF